MAIIDFPLDKLGAINRALAVTGDNTVNVADDGSPEWNCCSPAYEMAMGYVLECHGWNFATLVAELTNTGSDPSDPLFDSEYALPGECLHILWVRLDDRPVEYRFLDNKIVLNNSSDLTVTAKYIRPVDPTLMPPTLGNAIVFHVMSAIYRGLKKDVAEAGRLLALSAQILAEARTRHDQQAPKRAMFNSRLAGARRVRRPYPITPPGWTGTGIPS